MPLVAWLGGKSRVVQTRRICLSSNNHPNGQFAPRLISITASHTRLGTSIGSGPHELHHQFLTMSSSVGYAHKTLLQRRFSSRLSYKHPRMSLSPQLPMPVFHLECGLVRASCTCTVDTHPSLLVGLNGSFACWLVRLGGNTEVVHEEGRLGS